MSPARAASELHVVVVGAFAADCVIHMPVLPGWGEDHEARSMHTTPGGKALNQAVALARLGARVTAIGAIGDDAQGRQTLALLAAEGVDTSGIEIPENTATPLCLCFVGDDGQATYVSHTSKDVAVTPDTVRAGSPAISSADALITTLEPLPEAVGEAIELGQATDTYVVVQPAPIKYPHAEVTALPWSQADLVVPNESEARTLLDHHDAASGGAVDNLVTALAKQLKGPQVVITLAEHGCITLDEGAPTHYPAVEVPRVVDTTGGSDAFTAALTLKLTAGAAHPTAIRAGLSAASLAISKPGGHPSMPTVELGRSIQP